MEEIYRVADRITVLRDGRWVGTAERGDCPEPRLIQWMVGRDIAVPSRLPADARISGPGRPLLEVGGLTVPDPRPGRPPAVSDFSVSLRAGEIVGIAGLQGSGGTELFQGLFGAYGPVCGGRVRIDGKPFRPESPSDSIRRGLAYLTGDRKHSGLVLGLSVVDNITLASLPRLSPGGVLRPALERARAARLAETLRIRLASLEQPVGTLSGGNQQKVVLAKWLETQPKVLLLEEPTRGIDIGSKVEFYSLMEQWTAQGLAILLISTDLPELLHLSGRILALHRGRIAAEFSREEATPEKVMAAALGSTSLTPGVSGCPP
jgi:ABC-type sugar transport system ATPase subunit